MNAKSLIEDQGRDFHIFAMRKALLFLYSLAVILPGGCAAFFAPDFLTAPNPGGGSFWELLNVAGLASALLFGYRIIHVFKADVAEMEDAEGEVAYIGVAVLAILGTLAFFVFYYALSTMQW